MVGVGVSLGAKPAGRPEGTLHRYPLGPLTQPESRCLTTTNVIEPPHSGAPLRPCRVTHWKNDAIVLRWAATAFLEAEKHFRRITGYEDPRQLAATFDGAPRGRIRVTTKGQAA